MVENRNRRLTQPGIRALQTQYGSEELLIQSAIRRPSADKIPTCHCGFGCFRRNLKKGYGHDNIKCQAMTDSCNDGCGRAGIGRNSGSMPA